MSLDLTFTLDDSVLSNESDRGNYLAKLTKVFEHQVIRSPWDSIVDVETLHHKAKERLKDLLKNLQANRGSRCLTVHSSPGYGKTHLLAWVRQEIEQIKSVLFVSVPPYSFAGARTFDEHILLATIAAMFNHSREKLELIQGKMLQFLCKSYDAIVERGGSGKKILRTGSFWTWLLNRNGIKLSKRTTHEQKRMLQVAFERNDFLQNTFEEFQTGCTISGDGIRLDREAFFALCYLSCGNALQRYAARNWFEQKKEPQFTFDSYFLTTPHFDADKVRDILYTIHAVANLNFCMAFDQMEDIYQSLGPTMQASEVPHRLAISLRNLTAMPGMGLIFMFQSSIWQRFAQDAQSMLVDRMIEGGGVVGLEPLDGETARAVVRSRLQQVAAALPVNKQANDPHSIYPFTDEQIQKIRVQTGGELRKFLRELYDQMPKTMKESLTLVERPQLSITKINPCEVFSYEPTPVCITAVNVPEEIEVFLDGKPIEFRLDTQSSAIEITTPTYLVGSRTVRIQECGQAKNASEINLYFREREIPLPYCQHIDGVKIQQQRKKYGKTQKEVAERLQISVSQLSRIENNRWSSAPDHLYAALADLLAIPLSLLVRDQQ